jgi:hypothetical protein
VRSHVENGAVNGTTTRTISQEAKNLGSIRAEVVSAPAVAKHAPRRALFAIRWIAYFSNDVERSRAQADAAASTYLQ